MIHAAKKLGYHVTTTGNKPELIGHQFADAYCRADFSDKDEMLALAIRLEVDRVCACANDFGALSAAYVSERLGMPGHDNYDTALTLHHKDRFKNFAATQGLKTPGAIGFNSYEDALKVEMKPPMMIKPVDMSGGKGISLVQSTSELPATLKRAFNVSSAKKIVVEPFFQGSLHSFSTFIIDGRVRVHFSDNEYPSYNPFLVSTSAAPSLYATKYSSEIIAELEKVAASLKLVDGVLHAQYLANDSGFTILEITRRCSGDLHPLPISYAINMDWPQWIVRAECGYDCKTIPDTPQTGYCGRHCIMSSRNGIVDTVTIHERIRDNIMHSMMWWRSGDKVSDFKSQRLGIIVMKYDSMDEMMEKTQKIDKLVSVRMREDCLVE